jgi:2-oxoglutarate/2-oxoacid ferredoxin oxidoreductase subunit beta
VGLALQLGATFVGRSFSGDKDQLVPLIKAGLSHKGAAFIDVISPCVQFNNHPGSTKSFDYVREHNEAVNRLDVIPARAAISVDYAPGTTVKVAQHDGSILSLHKLADLYNPNNRAQALGYLQARQARGQVVTGLLYVDAEARDLHDALETVDTPLNELDGPALVPGAAALEKINAGLR